MQLLANVSIDIHNPTGHLANRLGYSLKARMHVGRSELTLLVFDRQTGKQAKKKQRYSPGQSVDMRAQAPHHITAHTGTTTNNGDG